MVNSGAVTSVQYVIEPLFPQVGGASYVVLAACAADVALCLPAAALVISCRHSC
jgi:hypothetical protein